MSDYQRGDFWHDPQETLDTKDRLSGAGIMDSANTLSVAVDERNDVAIGIGSAGLALDTLGLAIDPVGSLVSAAIGWLIDHVTPFRVPLDMLMGDPIGIGAAQDAIDAEKKKLEEWAEDHRNALENLRKSWRGKAADAFTRDMEGLSAHLDALGNYVDSASKQMGIAGGLVGAFRGVIRDIIAGVLGGIIAGAFAAAAAMPFTFGASVPIFLGTVAATVGITMAKIGVQIAKLTQKLTKSRANVDETGKAGDDAARAFGDAAGGGSKPTPGAGLGGPSAGDAARTGPGKDSTTGPEGGAGRPGGSQAGAGDGAGSPQGGSPPPKPDLKVDTNVPPASAGSSPSSGGTEYFTPDTSPQPGSGSPIAPTPPASGGATPPASGGTGTGSSTPPATGGNGSIAAALDGGGKPHVDTAQSGGGSGNPGPGGSNDAGNTGNAPSGTGPEGGAGPPGDGGKQGGDTSLKPGQEPPADKMVRYAKENLEQTIADKLPHARPAEHRIILDKFDQFADLGKPDLTKALGDQGAARFESIVKTLTDPAYGVQGFLSKGSVEFIKSMGDVNKELNMSDDEQ